MFPPIVATKGAVLQHSGGRGGGLPKSQKCAHPLQGMLEVIAEKQSSGWDVAFVDGSKDH